MTSISSLPVHAGADSVLILFALAGSILAHDRLFFEHVSQGIKLSILEGISKHGKSGYIPPRITPLNCNSGVDFEQLPHDLLRADGASM